MFALRTSKSPGGIVPSVIEQGVDLPNPHNPIVLVDRLWFSTKFLRRQLIALIVLGIADYAAASNGAGGKTVFAVLMIAIAALITFVLFLYVGWLIRKAVSIAARHSQLLAWLVLAGSVGAASYSFGDMTSPRFEVSLAIGFLAFLVIATKYIYLLVEKMNFDSRFVSN